MLADVTAALRMTRPTVDVLRLLLSAPKDDPLWGARISELADLGKSTVSQILTRLTALGWLTPREENGPHPGRPPRLFHTMSSKGRRQAAIALAARDGRSQHRAAGPLVPQAPTTPARQPIGYAQHTTPDPGTLPARPTPKMAGYWPIRFPKPGMPRPAPEDRATARTGANWPFLEGDDVPEHLTELTEVLTTLDGVNQSLAGNMFARAAGGPTHAEHYEKLVRAIIKQSSELRRRTQRAPHARPRGQDDG